MEVQGKEIGLLAKWLVEERVRMYDRALHAPLLKVLERALLPSGIALLADPWRDAGWEFADKLLASGWMLALDSRVVPTQQKPREVLLIHAVRSE